MVSKGNGNCTIYNVKEKKFLNVSKSPQSSDQWAPSLETMGRVWNIRQLNDITWSWVHFVSLLSICLSPNQRLGSICVDLEISRNKHGIPINITFALTVKDSTVGLSSHEGNAYEHFNCGMCSSADYFEANEGESWSIDLIFDVDTHFILSVVCAQSAMAHRACWRFVWNRHRQCRQFHFWWYISHSQPRCRNLLECKPQPNTKYILLENFSWDRSW